MFSFLSSAKMCRSCQHVPRRRFSIGCCSECRLSLERLGTGEDSRPVVIWKPSTRFSRSLQNFATMTLAIWTAAPQGHDSQCESGGIGRRTRLRIWRVKPWGFESPLSHQLNSLILRYLQRLFRIVLGLYRPPFLLRSPVRILYRRLGNWKRKVFVRHSADGPHRSDRFFERCRCRKWITLLAANKRLSAGTRSWEEAHRKAGILAEKSNATDMPVAARSRAPRITFQTAKSTLPPLITTLGRKREVAFAFCSTARATTPSSAFRSRANT